MITCACGRRLWSDDLAKRHQARCKAFYDSPVQVMSRELQRQHTIKMLKQNIGKPSPLLELLLRNKENDNHL